MTWQSSRVGQGQPGQVMITDEAAMPCQGWLAGRITASLSESRDVDVEKEMDELILSSMPVPSFRDAVK